MIYIYYTYIWYPCWRLMRWNYRTVSNFSVDSLKCELLSRITLDRVKPFDSNYIEGNTIHILRTYHQLSFNDVSYDSIVANAITFNLNSIVDLCLLSSSSSTFIRPFNSLNFIVGHENRVSRVIIFHSLAPELEPFIENTNACVRQYRHLTTK